MKKVSIFIFLVIYDIKIYGPYFSACRLFCSWFFLRHFRQDNKKSALFVSVPASPYKFLSLYTSLKYIKSDPFIPAFL